MSVGEKLVGAGAVIMALCCAVLPFVGAAVGGGLIGSANTIGIIVGAAVLVAIAVFLWLRRKAGAQC